MATPAWPASLPQFVQEGGYGETLPELKIESPVDTGEPKTRRRFTRGWRPINATIWCDAAQAKAFEVFYEGTLGGGVLPFTWVNPRTQRTALFRFRNPPPSPQPFGGGNVAYKFSLFQIVEYADFRFDSTTITFDSTLHTFDEMNI